MVQFHGYCELSIGAEVLVRVLVAAARAELHDALDTYVKGFQLLTNDILRHLSAYILD
jgi:hypothetical protein